MTQPDPEDLEYLASLEPAEFEKLILDNLAADAPERIWDALCHPRLVWPTSHVLREKATALREEMTEWRQVLGAAPQTWAAGDRAQALAEYQAWHPAAAALQRLVERRLRQVREARRRHVGEVIAPREVHNRAVIRRLAEGINGHRLACRAADLAAEPHDEALWGLLEELRLTDPSGGSDGSTLAEMLLSGPWSRAVEAVATQLAEAVKSS